MDYTGNVNFGLGGDGGGTVADFGGPEGGVSSGFGFNYWVILLMAIAILFGAYVMSARETSAEEHN